MAPSTVPVVVLAGTLGSGKTTMLNYVLSHAHARIGVIVNDFGAVNIDAMLLHGSATTSTGIAGGCLCCLADTGELDEALAMMTAPQAGLDVVIIESSGLAEPRALARLVAASPVATARPGGVIVLADAVALTRGVQPRLGLPPDEYAVASVVAVTKTDTLDAETRDKLVRQIREEVARAGGQALVTPSAHGHIDTSLFFDPNADLVEDDGTLRAHVRQIYQEEFATKNAGHHHATSVSFRSERPMNVYRMVEFFENLPSGVVRAKGVTYFAGHESARIVVHSVAGVVTMDADSAPDGQALTAVVCIGDELDARATQARLDACLDDAPAPAHAVDNLQRFMKGRARA